MRKYLVFPLTNEVKEVEASSAFVARNKYVQDHVAISPNIELIIVPSSHGNKGLAKIGQVLTELYKATIEGLSSQKKEESMKAKVTDIPEQGVQITETPKPASKEI